MAIALTRHQWYLLTAYAQYADSRLYSRTPEPLCENNCSIDFLLVTRLRGPTTPTVINDIFRVKGAPTVHPRIMSQVVNRWERLSLETH